MTVEQTQRWMARQAAILILLSLFTGLAVASAMTGKLPADAHATLASHLNAMLGAFWILGIAWTVPMLRFGATGRQRVAWAVVVSQYGNWSITALKAFWKVSGVDLNDDHRNNVIFGLLTALVVLPSLATAVAWIWGLRESGVPREGSHP